MTSVSTLALTGNSGQNVISIDVNSNNGFLFATIDGFRTVTRIAKVRLSDFSNIGELTLSLGLDYYPKQTAIDRENLQLFVVANDITATSKLVKVDLATDANLPPAESETLDLTTANNQDLSSTILDTDTNYLYIATTESPARIFKIDTRPNVSMSNTTTLTLSGLNQINGQAAIDEVNDNIFFISTSPSPKIIKVNLDTFTHSVTAGQLSLDYNDLSISPTLIVDETKGYAYAGGFNQSTSVPRAYKIAITPHGRLKLNYGQKTSSCTANDITWSDLGPAQDWNFNLTANFADGTSTTNVSSLLTDGNQSFKSGEIKENSSTSPEISLGEKEFTEYEYSIKPTSNSDYNNYCFKLVNTRNITPTNPQDPIDIIQTQVAEVSLQKVIIKGIPANVTEGSGSDTYTIELAEAPSDDVTINLTTTEPLLNISQAELVFTNSNFGPQTITLTANSNNTTEGPRVIQIDYSTTSTDPDFNNLTIPSSDINLTDTASSSTNIDVTVTGSIEMNAPDSFTFPEYQAGNTAPNFFRTQTIGEGNGSNNFKLSINDNRGAGTDYRIQVQASTDFTKGSGKCLPLDKIYVTTSNFTNSNGFNDTAISPTFTSNPNDIANYTTSTRRFATATDSNGCNATTQAITLLDTTLTGTEVKGTTSVDVNYAIDYANIPFAVEPGSYQVTLTYTLIDNP